MKTPYKQIKPLLIAGLATISLEAYASNATVTPFNIKPLTDGYQLAATEEGKCGQNKNKQGSCGGGIKADGEAVCGIYKIGSTHEDDSKVKDGKCGGHKVIEALCGEG